MAENLFVGSWRLVSWENRTTDGRVTHPLSKDVSGYILYTADGHMNVAIAAGGRPRLAANNLLGGTEQEWARAAKTYASYAGTYEIGEGEVIHHVEVSLFPNWVGEEQRRFFEFEGDRLTLSTAPMTLAGIESRAHLVWERTQPAL